MHMSNILVSKPQNFKHKNRFKVWSKSTAYIVSFSPLTDLIILRLKKLLKRTPDNGCFQKYTKRTIKCLKSREIPTKCTIKQKSTPFRWKCVGGNLLWLQLYYVHLGHFTTHAASFIRVPHNKLHDKRLIDMKVCLGRAPCHHTALRMLPTFNFSYFSVEFNPFRPQCLQ